MHVLIIESTCDETAAAVVDGDLHVLGQAVASQDELHSRFGGVVPEIAARAHVERMLPIIDTTLQRAQLALNQLDAVAVAHTPGLAGSLLVGLSAAKALALALDIPLVPINHLHGHIYACRMAGVTDLFPCVGLVVSGGHTSLYHCHSSFDFQLLGGTIDDAAGEAFDKVASMLGLPYPGGPALSRAARRGDRQKYRFPRSFLKDRDRLQFSFSGLKTAVRYKIAGPGNPDVDSVQLSDRQVADFAASFQEAVVDCLVNKARRALEITGLDTLCVGGGVAANERLRVRLDEEIAMAGYRLHIAPPNLCTDNAVMGGLAVERLRAGKVADLDLDVMPGLIRSGR